MIQSNCVRVLEPIDCNPSDVSAPTGASVFLFNYKFNNSFFLASNSSWVKIPISRSSLNSFNLSAAPALMPFLQGSVSCPEQPLKGLNVGPKYSIKHMPIRMLSYFRNQQVSAPNLQEIRHASLKQKDKKPKCQTMLCASPQIVL